MIERHARLVPMSDRDQIAAMVRLVASLSARVTALGRNGDAY